MFYVYWLLKFIHNMVASNISLSDKDLFKQDELINVVTLSRPVIVEGSNYSMHPGWTGASPVHPGCIL